MITTDVAELSLLISVLGLGIALIGLAISFLAILFSVIQWLSEIRRSRSQQRLEFIRQLWDGFSSHNWQLITHWDFPGVYPTLSEIAIENKTPEDQATFGKRITVLEHVNILLRVFTYRKLLTAEDKLGFKIWAQSWWNEQSEPVLRGIFSNGDLYPLDFMIWLQREIVGGSILRVMGPELKARLKEYEGKSRLFRRR
jgi:hypothetical protein